jgi:hypothetical protein
VTRSFAIDPASARQRISENGPFTLAVAEEVHLSFEAKPLAWRSLL